MIQVELKSLRKNAKNAYYRVAEMNADGAYDKITSYETLREAVFHAMRAQNGDIISRGSKSLLLYYCKHTQTVRFGFGAKEWEKATILRDLWWANINQSSLHK